MGRSATAHGRLRHQQTQAQEKRLKEVLAHNDPFDPAVCAARTALRDGYASLMLLDQHLADRMDVQTRMWQHAYYRPIELLRARMRPCPDRVKGSIGSSDRAGGKDPNNNKASNSKAAASDGSRWRSTSTSCGQGPPNEPDQGGEQAVALCLLRSLLDEGTSFYTVLIGKLREQEKGEDVRIHWCLLSLGDLARYRELSQGAPACQGPTDGAGPPRDWSIPAMFYLQAFHAWPASGQPHNQRAVLATYMDEPLLACCCYARAVASTSPSTTAGWNLRLLVHKAFAEDAATRVPGSDAHITPGTCPTDGAPSSVAAHADVATTMLGDGPGASNHVAQDDTRMRFQLRDSMDERKSFHQQLLWLCGVLLYPGMASSRCRHFSSTLRSCMRSLDSLLEGGDDDVSNSLVSPAARVLCVSAGGSFGAPLVMGPTAAEGPCTTPSPTPLLAEVTLAIFCVSAALGQVPWSWSTDDETAALAPTPSTPSASVCTPTSQSEATERSSSLTRALTLAASLGASLVRRCCRTQPGGAPSPLTCPLLASTTVLVEWMARVLSKEHAQGGNHREGLATADTGPPLSDNAQSLGNESPAGTAPPAGTIPPAGPIPPAGRGWHALQDPEAAAPVTDPPGTAADESSQLCEVLLAAERLLWGNLVALLNAMGGACLGVDSAMGGASRPGGGCADKDKDWLGGVCLAMGTSAASIAQMAESESAVVASSMGAGGGRGQTACGSTEERGGGGDDGGGEGGDDGGGDEEGMEAPAGSGGDPRAWGSGLPHALPSLGDEHACHGWHNEGHSRTERDANDCAGFQRSVGALEPQPDGPSDAHTRGHASHIHTRSYTHTQAHASQGCDTRRCLPEDWELMGFQPLAAATTGTLKDGQGKGQRGQGGRGDGPWGRIDGQGGHVDGQGLRVDAAAVTSDGPHSSHHPSCPLSYTNQQRVRARRLLAAGRVVANAGCSLVSLVLSPATGASAAEARGRGPLSGVDAGVGAGGISAAEGGEVWRCQGEAFPSPACHGGGEARRGRGEGWRDEGAGRTTTTAERWQRGQDQLLRWDKRAGCIHVRGCCTSAPKQGPRDKQAAAMRAREEDATTQGAPGGQLLFGGDEGVCLTAVEGTSPAPHSPLNAVDAAQPHRQVEASARSAHTTAGDGQGAVEPSLSPKGSMGVRATPGGGEESAGANGGGAPAGGHEGSFAPGRWGGRDAAILAGVNAAALSRDASSQRPEDGTCRDMAEEREDGTCHHMTEEGEDGTCRHMAEEGEDGTCDRLGEDGGRAPLGSGACPAHGSRALLSVVGSCGHTIPAVVGGPCKQSSAGEGASCGLRRGSPSVVACSHADMVAVASSGPQGTGLVTRGSDAGLDAREGRDGHSSGDDLHRSNGHSSRDGHSSRASHCRKDDVAINDRHGIGADAVAGSRDEQVSAGDVSAKRLAATAGFARGGSPHATRPPLLVPGPWLPSVPPPAEPGVVELATATPEPKGMVVRAGATRTLQGGQFGGAAGAGATHALAPTADGSAGSVSRADVASRQEACVALPTLCGGLSPVHDATSMATSRHPVDKGLASGVGRGAEATVGWPARSRPVPARCDDAGGVPALPSRPYSSPRGLAGACASISDPPGAAAHVAKASPSAAGAAILSPGVPAASCVRSEPTSLGVHGGGAVPVEAALPLMAPANPIPLPSATNAIPLPSATEPFPLPLATAAPTQSAEEDDGGVRVARTGDGGRVASAHGNNTVTKAHHHSTVSRPHDDATVTWASDDRMPGSVRGRAGLRRKRAYSLEGVFPCSSRTRKTAPPGMPWDLHASLGHAGGGTSMPSTLHTSMHHGTWGHQHATSPPTTHPSPALGSGNAGVNERPSLVGVDASWRCCVLSPHARRSLPWGPSTPTSARGAQSMASEPASLACALPVGPQHASPPDSGKLRRCSMPVWHEAGSKRQRGGDPRDEAAGGCSNGRDAPISNITLGPQVPSPCVLANTAARHQPDRAFGISTLMSGVRTMPTMCTVRKQAEGGRSPGSDYQLAYNAGNQQPGVATAMPRASEACPLASVSLHAWGSRVPYKETTSPAHRWLDRFTHALPVGAARCSQNGISSTLHN
eukprot:jgi/Mesvir1/16425/Mv25112-RA.1